MSKEIRKEVHTRTSFAYDRSEFYFDKMKHYTVEKSGNILTNIYTRKFLQARRIYVHYTQEYQLNQYLPLTY